MNGKAKQGVKRREAARARVAEVFAAQRERETRIESNVVEFEQLSEVERSLAAQLAENAQARAAVVDALKADSLSVAEVAALLEIPESEVRKMRVKPAKAAGGNKPDKGADAPRSAFSEGDGHD